MPPVTVTTSDNEWALKFCNFPAAWALTPRPGGKKEGEDIFVLHPDTGYSDHPELDAARYLKSQGKNFVKPGLSAKDDLWGSFLKDRAFFPGHGTSTASVMMSGKGAPTGAGPGYTASDHVTGAAPKVAVIPCKVARSVMTIDSSEAAIARTLGHAMALNPDHVGVVSVSLGRPSVKGLRVGGVNKAVELALAEAAKRGIIVVAAAGQFTKAVAKLVDPSFPGSDPNTICVGACDINHEYLDTAFWGPNVDITAPGVDVWVARSTKSGRFAEPTFTVEGNGLGTSFATAITAGACALWQAHHGRPWLLATYGAPLLLKLFREVLRLSCYKPAVWDTAKYGHGVLDALALLNQPLPSKAAIEAL